MDMKEIDAMIEVSSRYTTSDGLRFDDHDEAVDHQVKILRREKLTALLKPFLSDLNDGEAELYLENYICLFADHYDLISQNMEELKDVK